MSTGKTLLIVGGVAVGAYVLLELLKPSRPGTTSRPASSPTDLSFVSGLLAFGNLFAGSSKPPASGPNQVGSAAPGSFTPYAPGASSPGPWAPFDPNADIDPNTGGVELAPGDTYGPPTPEGFN